MIVADTGAIIALLDADEAQHRATRRLFESARRGWILPWAILPEVDYLAARRLGPAVAQAFLTDVVEGAFLVEWGGLQDLARAHELVRRHQALELHLVDAVVIAVAERLHCAAIATLDLRHFSAVPIRGNPKLLPRDS